VPSALTDKQIRAYAGIVYMHDHLGVYGFKSSGALAAFEWMLIEPTHKFHKAKVWEWMELGDITFEHNQAFDNLAEFCVPHGEGSDSVKMQGRNVVRRSGG